MSTSFADAALEERQRVTRALIERGLLLAGDPLFGLAGRHREQLASDLRDSAGYALQMSTDTARLYKPLTLAEAARPLAVPPRSAAESRRPVDERRVMDARRCLLVCLIGAVLERRTLWSQVPLTELAADVLQEARAQGLDVDWRRSADKSELLDAVAWLGAQGVLSLRSGSASRFGDGADEAAEAYYDISRTRLAAVLADPIRLAGARRAADVERPVAAAESPQARRQRLTRRLVEDPALYLEALDEPDRQYFLGQRAPIERRASELTGLQVERRREGSALIGAGRELSDRPFPAQSHRKQLALLLLAELCRIAAPGSQPPVALTQVERTVAELATRHRSHWGFATEHAAAPALAAAALELLEELMLVRRRGEEVQLLPAAWRYREVAVRTSAQQSLFDGEQGP